MVSFVENKQDFQRETEKFSKIFKLGTLFPENVFLDKFKFFIAFEFDLFFWHFFFEKMSIFIKNTSSINYTLYVIEPSANDYFYHHYKKYGIGIISADETYENYNDFLNFRLKNSQNIFKDYILETSETLAVFSDQTTWGIFASRSWEIGIVGFSTESARNIFLESFGEKKEIFSTLSEIINDYDEMFNFKPKTRRLYNNLLKSYTH